MPKASVQRFSITCNPDSKMAALADVSIAQCPGPEVVTGSTRMKSGTAQKPVLNMITTASMIKSRVSDSNLMIHVQMKNEKLQERGRHHQGRQPARTTPLHRAS
jgi:N-acetylmuramic acid 6-phosphate etherase